MKKLLIFFLLTTSFSSFAYDPLVDLDFSLSDFCYQQSGVQDRGGVYYFPNKEVGITATSICVWKDSYGQYLSKGNLKKGKKDGKWTSWHENGQKSDEMFYKDGNIDGTWIGWWGEGQKAWEWNYKNGKADGKFTFWDESGLILWKRVYKNDVCISGDCL